MSAMSELARQHDEARDISGIDLVECDLSYHKDAVVALASALEYTRRLLQQCAVMAYTKEVVPYLPGDLREELIGFLKGRTVEDALALAEVLKGKQS